MSTFEPKIKILDSASEENLHASFQINIKKKYMCSRSASEYHDNLLKQLQNTNHNIIHITEP